ncbi:hypothetical protein C8A00DRAFT_41446 [Chaetomidium leptoderma]|uniref:CBM1 domain-containing protein n=1 Tax=Chaetomidium leptoderma TaxID=669021 RepID=A0AAN6VT49_9PEZI|nr:hypothetical protein C8A00DRAFT_41446 [Chaetomidium leptoderma]
MRFQLPSWLSWYKKPEYRDIKEYATNISTGKRPPSPDGRNGGIPNRLQLERILANKTCSPMSLYDFYMYLKYIEYSAENLEFYIWFKNYEAAYAQGLAINDKDYGSIPSAAQSTSSVARINMPGDSMTFIEKHNSDDDDDDDNVNEAAQETLNRISHLIATTAVAAPCATTGACTRFPPPIHPNPPPPTPKLQLLNPFQGSSKKPPHAAAAAATATANAELPTIISLFLLPNSSKELNIPQSLRTRALADLARAPLDPAGLRPVADHVYTLLRNCSHRNFVRLGVGNGTFETVCVATVLGWANLVAGFLVVLCRATVPFRGAHTRWEAFAAWPLWWLGMSLVLSGLRGSCFFLLLFSRRQRLPWERFDDESERGRAGAAAGGLRENRRLGGGRALAVLATALGFIQGVQAADEAGVWGQCGGIDYSGPTKCVSGATCTAYNDWYRPPVRSRGGPQHHKHHQHILCGGHHQLLHSHHPHHLDAHELNHQRGPSSSNPLGNPPLPGWTASGGLNWVGFLASQFNTSTLLTYNFAYGGATTNATIVPPYESTVLSLIDQVAQFSGSIANKPSYAPWGDNALFAVWIGVNDVGNTWWKEDYDQIVEQTMASYFGQLQVLYAAGARNFVLLSVPPIHRTPAMLGESADTQKAEAASIAKYNAAITTNLAAFKTKNGDISAKIVDTTAPFNTALDNPTAHGSPDATCFNADGKSCLWFNDYHPGIEINRLVAKAVADAWKDSYF